MMWVGPHRIIISTIYVYVSSYRCVKNNFYDKNCNKKLSHIETSAFLICNPSTFSICRLYMFHAQLNLWYLLLSLQKEVRYTFHNNKSSSQQQEEEKRMRVQYLSTCSKKHQWVSNEDRWWLEWWSKKGSLQKWLFLVCC